MVAAGRIARLSLLLLIIVSSERQAVPWREKNAFRVAASLPAKLIDSIMAQGNWNILFQEGPFSEFQRQVAIANHFALRGDKKQAEFYFQKAETALDIAYGLLRGRFSWPRSYRELKAADLPWGENRDTFQDHVLCRLQLHVETGLRDHAAGKLNFENLQRVLEESEKQLSTSIERRDTDLASLLRIIQDAIVIRNLKGTHTTLLAEKFAAASDGIAPSLRNYWSRRLHLFRIFENLYHGNLGRALWLTDYLGEKQNDQGDPISLSQLYIRLSAYSKAEKVLKQAVESQEFRQQDTYGDHLQASETLQNMYTWIGRTADAEATGLATLQILTGLRESGTIPRDESLALRQAISDQELRQKIYAYAFHKSCPAPSAFSGDAEMPGDWRIKERIFFENCGMPRDPGAWKNLLAIAGLSSEALAVAEYHVRTDKAVPRGKPREAANDNLDIRAYLRESTQLERLIQSGDKKKSADALIRYLRAKSRFSSEMLIFEWGFSPPDLIQATLKILPKTLNDNKAAALFADLHREYALRTLRGKPLQLFSPGDAVILSDFLSRAVLGTVSPPREINLSPIAGKHLVFSDESVTIQYSPGTKEGKLNVAWFEDKASLAKPGQMSGVLYGSALWEISPSKGDGFEYPPLFTYCANCAVTAGTPERLIMNAQNGTLKTDLADNFSLAPDIHKASECAPAVPAMEDTLYFQPAFDDQDYMPCDLRISKLMLDFDNPEELKAASYLLFSMGWRRDLSVVMLPRAMTAQARSAYLFDFFQRINRRSIKSREAFKEAKSRAEKSFPEDVALRSVRYYESTR